VIHSRILANYPLEWVGPNTLIFFLTASGTTTDVIEAVKAVKKKNPHIIILTQLGKKSPGSVYDEIKGYKKSRVIVPLSDGKVTWPSTTTFHTFLAILNLLFTYVMKEMGLKVDSLLNIQLLDLPDYLDEISENPKTHEWCSVTAKNLLKMETEGFYFLGDGPRYAAALKGALVHFVESTKQDSFAIQNEEFVHLVVEVLADENENKNVLFLLKPRESHVTRQANNRFEEIRSLWTEKAGKDKVVVVDPFQFTSPKGIGLKNDILLTPLYVVLLQWLSYYYALYKKLDPTKKALDL
jgi:glucosamine 6-phosphate synthetase-like amidotransferase/phosphosugar isomerase protein